MSATPDPLLAARPRLGAEAQAIASRVLAMVVADAPLVGRYRRGKVLGSGAYGVVVSAHDLELDRPVAIKQLRAVGPAATASILEEARTLATLSHPNVVQVFEVGLDPKSNAPYTVMELVEGESLDVWLRARARPWRRVVELVIQAARGLSAAHAAGVLHRDVKPANLLLGVDGRLRVVDFGLAKTDLPATTATGPSSDGESAETKMGVGTPAYLAPEGFEGQASPASDQFSLAAVLFEGLTGTRAMVGSSLAEIRARHRRGVQLPKALPGGRTLRRALARGLAKDPQGRHRNMDAFADALERSLRPRSSWTLAIAGLGTLGLAAALWAESPDKQCTTDPSVWVTVLGRAGANENVRAAGRAYAEAWTAAEQEACRAGAPLEPATRLCFDARRSDAEALLELHGQQRWSDHDAVAQAVQELGDPADCGGPTEERPAPSGAALARVSAVQPMLSKLRALSRAADLEGSLRYSEEVLVAARATGYAPLIVETASLRGRALMLSSRREEAREVLEEAYFAARKASLPRASGEMAAGLMLLVGSKFGDTGAGYRWAEHAKAAYGRAGLDPMTTGTYVQGLITLAQREGRFDEQERLARLAEKAEIDAGRSDSETRASMVAYRGAAQYMRQDYEAALETFELGSVLAEARYGPRTAPVSALLDNRGAVLRLLERYDEALPLAELALQIREETYPAGSVDLAYSYGNLAILYGELERFDDALRYSNRAMKIFEEKLGSSSGDLGRAHHSRADILQKMGKAHWPEAVEDYQAALVIFADAGGEFARSVEQIEEEVAKLEAALQ